MMTSHFLPIIHLSGTRRRKLVDLRAATIDALHAAGSALAKMAPNGRDYYQEPGLLVQAQEQHDQRMNVLTSLIKEIEVEMIAVDRSEP